jgi:hypothetical protein
MGDFPPLLANQPGEEDAEEGEGEPERKMECGKEFDREGDRGLDKPEAEENNEEK